MNILRNTHLFFGHMLTGNEMTLQNLRRIFHLPQSALIEMKIQSQEQINQIPSSRHWHET